MIRALLIMAVAVTLSACSSDDTGDVGEGVTVQQRDQMTAGPLDGTEVGAYDNAGGPEAGTQADLVVNVGDRVFFGYDRFDVADEARMTLDKQAAWLKQYPNVRVTVEGHCDERGTREYNLALGERRANSVKNYLVSMGVESSRITTISYGKERPAVPGSDPTAWAQNRRGVTKVD